MASADATENARLPCVTYKKGSSADMASLPARKIAPSTRQAQTKTIADAANADSTGRSTFCPTSSKTGAASNTFIPAYSTPMPPPAGRSVRSVPPRA